MDVRQAQLFIDDEIIEHQTLLERILHQPARPRGNPVLCPEKPWEGESIAFCAGVYRVSETGGYRMWYATSGVLLGGYTHCICVAESDDGVSWQRPELDFYREAAGGPSNIVWATDQVLDGPTVSARPSGLRTPVEARLLSRRQRIRGDIPRRTEVGDSRRPRTTGPPRVRRPYDGSP